MSAYSHSGRVYFVAAGDYIKIGYTSAPIGNRLHSLANEVKSSTRVTLPAGLDRSARLRLIVAIPGCVMRDEKRLHSLFAAHRVAGEWFRYDEAFVGQFDRMQYVTYAESLLYFRRARAELKRATVLEAAA